jgi:tRNA A37 threonylcarbamoyladenosine dehydratase
MMDREVDLERRFGGIIRLYGEKKFRLIQNCHVCVVGIGGVGFLGSRVISKTWCWQNNANRYGSYC